MGMLVWISKNNEHIRHRITKSSPVLLRPTAPHFWFSSSSAFAFSLFPLCSPLSSWSDQPVDFCNFRFFLSAYNFDICHGPLRWLRGYGHYPIGCLCSLVCSSSIGPLSSLGRPVYFSKGDRCWQISFYVFQKETTSGRKVGQKWATGNVSKRR